MRDGRSTLKASKRYCIWQPIRSPWPPGTPCRYSTWISASMCFAPRSRMGSNGLCLPVPTGFWVDTDSLLHTFLLQPHPGRSTRMAHLNCSSNVWGSSKLVIPAWLSCPSASGIANPGDNQPGRHMAFGRWGQQMWLSNEDWAHAVECACLNPFQGAAVINIMSENAGMRWDLSEARDAIGYIPKSRSTPRLGALGTLKDLLAQAREWVLTTRTGKPLFGKRW